MKISDWPAIHERPARIVRSLLVSRNIIWDSDHRIVEKSGLSWTQFSTLVSLRFAAPNYTLSPTELYSSAQASSGGMTKVLARLQDLGFITRQPNENDRRSQLVQLTQDGAEVVENLIDQFNASNGAKIDGILSSDEADQLAILLEKLTTGLRQNNP